MQWSVVDLSIITGELIAMLNAAIANSPMFTAGPDGTPQFDITVSGAMPADVRDQGGCQLSLYLLHIGRDAFWRNAPTADWTQAPAGNSLPRPNRTQPLSLNLSYLLTAWAGTNADHEQQAMSIALNCFHEQAIVRQDGREFTITVEGDSIEEMSRLWQAIGTPIRLSALFRVGVVFLQPSLPPPTQHAPPTRATISVGTALSARPPQLFQPALQVAWAPAVDVADVGSASASATIVAGARVRVGGAGLAGASAAQVYLAEPGAGAARWPVTAWRQAPAATASVSPAELVLDFPPAYGAPPAAGTPLSATPPPGVYLLSVGDAAAPRSAAVPLVVGPAFTGLATPPQLMPDAGVYTLGVAGLVAGATVVLVDAVELAETTGGTPAAGRFVLDLAQSRLRLTPPALPAGRHVVRVLVNGFAPPSATPWFDLP